MHQKWIEQDAFLFGAFHYFKVSAGFMSKIHWVHMLENVYFVGGVWGRGCIGCTCYVGSMGCQGYVGSKGCCNVGYVDSISCQGNILYC